MNEKILSLIYDYSRNGKVADKDFILKVVNLVVSYREINDYVKSIGYEQYNKLDYSSILGYNYSEKKIIIYEKKLDEYLNSTKSTDAFIPYNEKLFYKNVEIVEALLHELEHANQSKIMEKDNTVESSILKLIGVGKSRELFAVQLKKIGLSNEFINDILSNKIKNYYKYYEFAPHERLAEINAHQKMSEILSPIKNFVPNIYNIENILVLKNKLKGYTYNNIFISPTIFYLKNQGEGNSLEIFNWYDKDEKKCLELSKRFYNFEKRINLGLPVEINEYNKLNNNYKKLVKSM